MNRHYNFNLLLLPAFFLLHNNNALFGFLAWQQVMEFVIVAPLLTLAFFYSLKSLLKSGSVAAVCTLLVQLFILFFGPFHDFLKSFTNGSVLSSYKVVLIVIPFLIFLATRYFQKHRPAALKFSLFATTVLSALCLYEVTISGIHFYNLTENKNLIYPQLPVCSGYTSCNLPDSSKPDIFFLVFDEYTNNKTLKEVWNYDNSEISRWLKAKGFYTIPESRANYTSTSFSLSSTFNMNYISERNSKGTIRNYLRSNNSLSYNETFCLLQKENYITRFLAPYKNSLEENGLINYTGYMYKNWLFMHTLLGRFNRDIVQQFVKGKHALFNKAPDDDLVPLKKRIEDTHRTITKIKETVNNPPGKPQFVYGHLLITHDPHLFDSTGAFLGYHKPQPFDTYVQQVQYANTIIKELVTYIQDNNKKNTVIIIEGDHGFRLFPKEKKEYFFPNFNAVYFPDNNYHQLYPQMSPVNTFRVVFNHYFCQNLPLLKDSSILINDHD